MSAAGIALLLGLFGAPAALLWLGHRLRGRGPAAFGAFWGGVVGHSLALLAMLLAAHWPPVAWSDTASPRARLIHWSLVAGAVAGAAAGALLARLRSRSD